MSKLFKTGNSVCASINPSILDMLGLKEGAEYVAVPRRWRKQILLEFMPSKNDYQKRCEMYRQTNDLSWVRDPNRPLPSEDEEAEIPVLDQKKTDEKASEAPKEKTVDETKEGPQEPEEKPADDP